jgi:hypothetical protein
MDGLDGGGAERVTIEDSARFRAARRVELRERSGESVVDRSAMAKEC